MEDKIIISSDNPLLQNIAIEFDNGFRKEYVLVSELIKIKKEYDSLKNTLDIFSNYAEKIVELKDGK
ncbi:MAG: hypothetical protein IIY58_00185 [Aeriscardovia sp.]|nr:hypothetical protein [Aeriscardovia sp.]